MGLWGAAYRLDGVAAGEDGDEDGADEEADEHL
jgi:hypothetical protein